MSADFDILPIDGFKLDEFLESATCAKLTLCGSRYFAATNPSLINVEPHTDWDFFCGEDPQIEKELLDAGFYLVQPAREHLDRYPYDDLALRIYQTTTREVQVIVRSDPELYDKVLLSIGALFYRDFLWKSGPNKPERDQIQRIMNQLFTVAKESK